MITAYNAYLGTEIKVNSFDLFTSICKYVAEKLHTLEEHREYTEYNWGSVWFMTDKFGGNYSSFHYDLKTHEVTYMKGESREEKITTLARLVDLVEADKKKMEKARDLGEISRRVNAEY